MREMVVVQREALVFVDMTGWIQEGIYTEEEQMVGGGGKEL